MSPPQVFLLAKLVSEKIRPIQPRPPTCCSADKPAALCSSFFSADPASPRTNVAIAAAPPDSTPDLGSPTAGRLALSFASEASVSRPIGALM